MPMRKWFISILLAATCTIAAVWALTIAHLWHEEAQAVREAETVNAHLAAALEDQALRTFGSVEQALTFVAKEYRRLGRTIDLPRLLGDSPIDVASYVTMAIMAADGTLIAQTHDTLPAGYLYERLLAHRADTGNQPLVGRPIQLRAGEQWIIPISKRIHNADDSFDGIVFAGLNASHFTDFYAQVLLGGAGAMMLVSQEGIVLARSRRPKARASATTCVATRSRAAFSNERSATISAAAPTSSKRPPVISAIGRCRSTGWSCWWVVRYPTF